MFIGHFGIGLAAKKVAPAANLGVLFLAAQLLDLLWPAFLLLGWEHAEIKSEGAGGIPLSFTDYPVSHSLLAVAIWASGLALVYYLFKRNEKIAFVLAACVLSHWALDLLVHEPDLPLYPGAGPKAGLGLWNQMPVAIVVETILFATGVFIYARCTKPRNRKGVYAFWSLVAFLLVIHFANLFGPPPPDMRSVAWVGLAQWIFVLWAWWADRNRQVTAIS